MELPTKENPTTWNDSQDKMWFEDGVVYWIRTVKSLTHEQSKSDMVVVKTLTDELEKRGLPKVLLIDIGPLKKVSREAREEYIGLNVFAKMAVVNDSPIVRMMVSFAQGLNTMSMPIKAFKSDEEAIKWLKN